MTDKTQLVLLKEETIKLSKDKMEAKYLELQELNKKRQYDPTKED